MSGAADVRASDPREGQDVLALWDFVYDFDDDVGGFASGQFLLRADGVLWIRTGGSSWAGAGTSYRFRPWQRWTLEPGPFDVASAFAAVRRRNHHPYPPGPTPVDAERSGPFAGHRERPTPLTARDAPTWTAPGSWIPA